MNQKLQELLEQLTWVNKKPLFNYFSRRFLILLNPSIMFSLDVAYESLIYSSFSPTFFTPKDVLGRTATSALCKISCCSSIEFCSPRFLHTFVTFGNT